MQARSQSASIPARFAAPSPSPHCYPPLTGQRASLSQSLAAPALSHSPVFCMGAGRGNPAMHPFPPTDLACVWGSCQWGMGGCESGMRQELHSRHQWPRTTQWPPAWPSRQICHVLLRVLRASKPSCSHTHTPKTCRTGPSAGHLLGWQRHQDRGSYAWEAQKATGVWGWSCHWCTPPGVGTGRGQSNRTWLQECQATLCR